MGGLGFGWRRAGAAGPVSTLRAYADGHARPRALAVDARGDRLYVAASTADRLVVVDLLGPHPRQLISLRICAFPDALAALPGGGVVVSCRFDPALRVVSRASESSDAFQVRAVPTGLAHGNRGLALDPAGRFAYVGSPARGGVKIVALDGTTPRFFPTGVSPQGLRFVPPDPGAGRATPLLLVANFIGHTVGVYPVLADGGVGAALQTIETAAPILALTVVPSRAPARDAVKDGAPRGALLLATHEDRALSRERLAVEGLDSVVLSLPAAPPGAAAPFVDPGPGHRFALNLSERSRDPVVGLDAVAFDEFTDRVAIAGAGSDNLVVARAAALAEEPAVDVGTSPSAVTFLPDGGVVTADRLSDTLSFVHGTDGTLVVTDTLAVGKPERTTRAERGEVLFYSRRLVPNNVATGPLSIYTCAACHADGHIDGRRHPSKRNRFFSMTKTCRGLVGTEPFLSLGKPDTFAAFADNIVATHAQGALDAPDSYDQYPVTLRLREGARWGTVTLSPREVRATLAAYLPRLPVEPSPFEAVGRTALTPPERDGLAVFRDRCSGCHQLQIATGSTRAVPARELERDLLAGRLVLTSARRYDVGTPVLGEDGNNPPSLRGVWAAAPYFSDGSAATLEDVLRRTDPGVPTVHAPENAKRPAALTVPQRRDLLAFLRGL
jgi:DNA-binding beta-propeller fold protein YncE